MGVAPKDAIIPENSLSELIVDKHIDFIANYETNKNTKYEYSMSESLRMSGIYWACTALDIMNASDRMEKNRVKSLLLLSKNIASMNFTLFCIYVLIIIPL